MGIGKARDVVGNWFLFGDSHSFQCSGRKHVTVHNCTPTHVFKDECCRTEVGSDSKPLADTAALAQPSLQYPWGEWLLLLLFRFVCNHWWLRKQSARPGNAEGNANLSFAVGSGHVLTKVSRGAKGMWCFLINCIMTITLTSPSGLSPDLQSSWLNLQSVRAQLRAILDLCLLLLTNTKKNKACEACWTGRLGYKKGGGEFLANCWGLEKNSLEFKLQL